MAVRANPNLKQRTLMVAGAAIVIIAVMVTVQVWQTYNTTVAAARRDVQQFSQILEANTENTFEAAEVIIDHAIEEILDGNDVVRARSEIAQRFVSLGDKWRVVHSIGFLTADGTMAQAVIREPDGRLHTVAKLPDVRGQPLFEVHVKARERGERMLYVARPGRDMVSSAWVLTISKAIYDKENIFRGVCLVTVTLDTFTRAFGGSVPTRYTSIELFRRDGAPLASTTPDRKRELSDVEKRVFGEMVPAAPAGVYRVNGENSDQLLSYRVLKRYPAVVVIKANWSQVIDRWSQSSQVLVASALIGILVIIGLTLWLIRRIGAEQATQRALAASENSLSESQRLSGIGYFERAVNSQIPVWSPLMYQIHGVTPETFAPDRAGFSRMVIPEDQDKLMEAWRAVDSSKVKDDVECRIRTPDGDIRHIRYAWRIFDNEDGRPSRIFGVAQDVTAIRNAESIIREDAERLHDIVECSSDYIWELDTLGVIRLFSGNNMGGAWVGHPLVLADHIPLHDDGDRFEMRNAVAKRDKFRSLLIPTLNETGETRWLRVSGNPRFDAKGNYLGYRGAGTDVTELRARSQQDEASRKAEALGRLASGLAHEINNLLQPIMIYANFGAAQNDAAANVRQYFQRISRAAERSMLIVRNVLAFARQSPPRRENVQVIDVVHETVDFMDGTLAPGTLLEIRDNAGDLAVRVDRTGLGQVLVNLLTNAAEAVPTGGPVPGRIGIAIGATHLMGTTAATLRLAPGVYCCLEIEDNGPGIPPHQIDQVFDPFFTTKPQGKGTGLGLSVVSGLAKSWGGTVTVDSVPGLKTSFKVYLPIAERQLQAAQ
ncbi:MAG: PAS domain-containing protein [Rhodospirillaceae bacterium]|nr:PAS domain-containing protein [Rhodospirillaceae bacterium]